MDVYEIVTEKIVNSLEQGTVPWHCPWKRHGRQMPSNLISKKPYTGINPFLLNVESIIKDYSSPYWLTYKQAQELGGNVRQGERSSLVVFWKRYETKERDEKTGELITVPVLRYYNVFNTQQCDGIDEKVPALPSAESYSHDPIAEAEAIVANMPNRPEIVIRRSNRACYSPATDTVAVPELAQFPKAEEYYSALFHELGHSTGHKSRLNREFGSLFGDHTYSKEELVAEFCASYLCAVSGIERATLDNSASYIDHWLSVLKDQKNKKWLVWTASHAQKAANYIQRKSVVDLDVAA